MSRTLLFLAVLAALLCVGVSEQDLKGRVGLSSISNSNNNKDNKNFLNKIRNFLQGDGATESHDNGNGKGHDQHGKGHGKKVDCVVGEWQSWASCSKTCGGGTRPRTRAILTQPSYGGLPCPETTQDQPCNTQSCGVDCVVGEWTSWGSCSKTCGGGNRTLTRAILTQPSYGGKPCPATEQTQPCNTQSCEVPCVVGEWSNWGPCSKSCDGGNQTRTRPILTQPSYGGHPCPETIQLVPCNTQYCEVPCVVGEWSNWGLCSKSCNGGNQTRTRPILTQPSYGGAPCPETIQLVPCNTQYCEVPCAVGEWSNWGSCSKECSNGTRTRTRAILTPPSNGGAPCPETIQLVPCNTQPCEVPCVVGEWSNWGSCSKSCGGGVLHRTRQIITPPSANGRPCPETSGTVPCNTQSCY